MITQQELKENIARVREQIASAAKKAGRNPEEITLVAVSKTVPIDQLIEAHTLGINNFGENYLQEALPKISSFPKQDVSWHMIGHLQSNKVNKVVPDFHYIHTVDSVHLAQKIDQQARKLGKVINILLQVNITGEESKSGLTQAETISAAEAITKLTFVSAVGLMTIPQFSGNPEDTRPVFRSLRLLRDRLKNELPESRWEHLSMGMSNDYTIAIEEGATIIRVGQAIFGVRKSNR